ncbi:MAG: hypothetical protein RLZZ490_1067 [Cyanobacteriota bacterium]|jgi:hypothetical protein
MTPWTYIDCFAKLQTPWLTLIGEKWLDDQQTPLDYWRVQKADSLIIVPQQGDRLLLPKPMFRPGIGATTWDFPGGRLLDRARLLETLTQILQRELTIHPPAIIQTQAINTDGWMVNSSFSNQKLYGYWVEIDPDYVLPQTAIGATFQIPQDFPPLLQRLTCLQCRALFLEWQHQCLSSKNK